MVSGASTLLGLGPVALLSGARADAWPRPNRLWRQKSTINWPAISPLPTIFPARMRELAAAFEHQFKTLDERLAGDIEEGGKLYELASTAPFDKAVNDLLLNMSIGIG